MRNQEKKNELTLEQKKHGVKFTPEQMEAHRNKLLVKLAFFPKCICAECKQEIFVAERDIITWQQKFETERSRYTQLVPLYDAQCDEVVLLKNEVEQLRKQLYGNK